MDDEELEFHPGDKEYDALYALAEQWLARAGITSISNSDEGFALGDRFEQWVRAERVDVAVRVKGDPLVYNAVLIDWNMRRAVQ